MKIMVVDDELDIQLLFRQRFRKEIKSGEFHFHYAFSGADALAFLENDASTSLVLILSDINMPGMSGLELLRHIKEVRPGLKIFMITAYDDTAKHDAAIEFGADDYITKPIDFQALKQKILSATNAE